MPLQAGGWTANIGGTITQLLLNGADPSGNVGGSLFGSPIQGFWDEDSQKLFFMRSTPGSATGQVFVGFLFQDSVNLIGVQGAVIFTLAGYVENFSAAGFFVGPTPTAARPVFGWYAQIGVD